MEWEWYKKMSFGWVIVTLAYAGMLLWILFTIDYVPFLLFFGGMSFVLMLFSFSGIIICCLDVFKQKEIHRLKTDIKKIDRVIDLKKRGIIP